MPLAAYANIFLSRDLLCRARESFRVQYLALSHLISVFLDLQHIQPIHDHHRFDQVSFQIHMPTPTSALDTISVLESERERSKAIHSIKLITLNTHIPRPQMLDAPPPRLNTHRLLEQHQRLVPLTHDPLVWFLPPRRIRRHEQARPKHARLAEVGELRGRCFEDRVEPVQGRLQVEVVPEAVAEDERVGFRGLFGAEDGSEAVEFFGGDGEADHCFDW